MNPDAVRFALVFAVSFAALGLGYASRRRGWMDEKHSRAVHFHTVTWAWSAGALIALWRLPLTLSNLWIVAIQAAVIVIPALLMIPLAKRVCTGRGQVGVMAVGAGVGNIGWTLGAYICFILIDPAGEALAVAGTAAAVLAVVNVLAMYPIAHRFGELTGGLTLGKLMVHSLFMLPAMPLYAGAVGVTLSATTTFPEWLIDFYLVDLVLLTVAAGGYLGVGMRLRLGGGLAYLKQHALLAVFTFGVTPAITLGIIALAGATAAPMSETATRVMIVEALMPTGVSCIIMANIFHLDARLAASVWLWNTLLCLALILPGLVLWLGL
ncbi:MAG: hypothetical protein GVY24_04920 [Planctomycetes bacterium]|jgi:predicted permease|nr:hypothetical protein [Planctomycetota bacterium]